MQTVRPRAVQWRTTVELSAHLAAVQLATLAPGRGGVVTKVNFQSCQRVTAGEVLVVLDVDPEQAQLALDEAKLTEAIRTLDRTRKLMSISGASQSALEQAEAALAEDQARLRLDQATLAQGEIIAPFNGTTGLRDIDPGDYVSAGQKVVTLAAAGRLKVYFSVPQSEAAGLTPGESFSFTAPVGGRVDATAAGKLVALSPTLDRITDARPAEGRLEDENPALLSGMSGVVKIATGAVFAAFSVPSTALNDSMLGPYVFVVTPGKSGGVLHSVYVKILDSDGKNSIVQASGLKVGEHIVSLGGFKLNNGQRVSLALH